MNLCASQSCKAVLYVGDRSADLQQITAVVPKPLLPVYDKPLVYYPLSIVMLAGIRRVAIVVRANDRPAFERLLGDGRTLGIEIEYLALALSGPAAALDAAQEFLGDSDVLLVESDTLVCGEGLQRVLAEAMSQHDGAVVLAHPVGDARHHPVIELDASGRPKSIEVQAHAQRSSLATMGIAKLSRDVVTVARGLAAENPHGFTIADLLARYLAQQRLTVKTFGRGFAWLDTSTPAALLAATNFIETIETAHGLKIGCLEEIAYERGWITRDAVRRAAESMNNGYGAYLRRIVAGSD